eukprot:362822-Chlamydomonas_euryale.AAC.22
MCCTQSATRAAAVGRAAGVLLARPGSISCARYFQWWRVGRQPRVLLRDIRTILLQQRCRLRAVVARPLPRRTLRSAAGACTPWLGIPAAAYIPGPIQDRSDLPGVPPAVEAGRAGSAHTTCERGQHAWCKDWGTVPRQGWRMGGKAACSSASHMRTDRLTPHCARVTAHLGFGKRGKPFWQHDT